MDQRHASAESSAIQVLEGSTFMLSDAWGDVAEDTAAGLFHEDTRHLTRFILEVGGSRPVLLSSATASYRSAAFFLTNPDLPDLPANSVSIQRYRSITDGTLDEVLVLQSHVSTEVSLDVRLSCAADFADLFEVKLGTVRARGVTTIVHDEERSLLFEYRRDGFRAATRVHATKSSDIDCDDLVFRVRLSPRGEWKARILVAISRGDEGLPPIDAGERPAAQALTRWRESGASLERWRAEAPSLDSEWDVVKLVYQCSVDDLAALRFSAFLDGREHTLLAAGLPWFIAIFGRDTLITAYQSLLVRPDLAAAALEALAALQGRRVDHFKDEEPGKILHEIRFGELTASGESPHRPYYGTADATPLFLVLLSEYWRVTRDAETVRRLRANAEAALQWIDGHGDLDGDGFVEYQTRSSRGLRNQGWKDSWDAVLFADGRLAEPPIALSEVQGYVYDAKVRAAELATAVWGDHATGERLRREADVLFDRFNERFWIEGGGYYAEALDGEKRVVDAVTSNMGHLLWSGIVPPDRARRVADRLFSEGLWSGWGIRTLDAGSVAYNPIAYHNGTVWPHDNSLIAAGLHRYGFRDLAGRIAVAMFEAASFTSYRLPEVFAGYPRTESGFPVRYPTASSPQAWATAAPFLWLRILLGIEPRDGALDIDPLVPESFGEISVDGLPVLGRRYSLRAKGRTYAVDVESG